MSVTKKVEMNENFIEAWREEPSLWDVTSPLYKNRDESQKSKNRLIPLDKKLSVAASLSFGDIGSRITVFCF